MECELCNKSVVSREDLISFLNFLIQERFGSRGDIRSYCYFYASTTAEQIEILFDIIVGMDYEKIILFFHYYRYYPKYLAQWMRDMVIQGKIEFYNDQNIIRKLSIEEFDSHLIEALPTQVVHDVYKPSEVTNLDFVYSIK